ncbi:MAG: hypothetical protein EOO65_00985, partial [Methanosarcinales archaeon]
MEQHRLHDASMKSVAMTALDALCHAVLILHGTEDHPLINTFVASSDTAARSPIVADAQHRRVGMPLDVAVRAAKIAVASLQQCVSEAISTHSAGRDLVHNQTPRLSTSADKLGDARTQLSLLKLGEGHPLGAKLAVTDSAFVAAQRAIAQVEAALADRAHALNPMDVESAGAVIQRAHDAVQQFSNAVKAELKMRADAEEEMARIAATSSDIAERLRHTKLDNSAGGSTATAPTSASATTATLLTRAGQLAKLNRVQSQFSAILRDRERTNLVDCAPLSTLVEDVTALIDAAAAATVAAGLASLQQDAKLPSAVSLQDSAHKLAHAETHLNAAAKVLHLVAASRDDLWHFISAARQCLASIQDATSSKLQALSKELQEADLLIATSHELTCSTNSGNNSPSFSQRTATGASALVDVRTEHRTSLLRSSSPCRHFLTSGAGAISTSGAAALTGASVALQTLTPMSPDVELSAAELAQVLMQLDGTISGSLSAAQRAQVVGTALREAKAAKAARMWLNATLHTGSAPTSPTKGVDELAASADGATRDGLSSNCVTSKAPSAPVLSEVRKNLCSHLETVRASLMLPLVTALRLDDMMQLGLRSDLLALREDAHRIFGTATEILSQEVADAHTSERGIQRLSEADDDTVFSSRFTGLAAFFNSLLASSAAGPDSGEAPAAALAVPAFDSEAGAHALHRLHAWHSAVEEATGAVHSIVQLYARRVADLQQARQQRVAYTQASCAVSQLRAKLSQLHANNVVRTIPSSATQAHSVATALADADAAAAECERMLTALHKILHMPRTLDATSTQDAEEYTNSASLVDTNELLEAVRKLGVAVTVAQYAVEEGHTLSTVDVFGLNASDRSESSVHTELGQEMTSQPSSLRSWALPTHVLAVPPPSAGSVPRQRASTDAPAPEALHAAGIPLAALSPSVLPGTQSLTSKVAALRSARAKLQQRTPASLIQVDSPLEKRAGTRASGGAILPRSMLQLQPAPPSQAAVRASAASSAGLPPARGLALATSAPGSASAAATPVARSL